MLLSILCAISKIESINCRSFLRSVGDFYDNSFLVVVTINTTGLTKALIGLKVITVQMTTMGGKQGVHQ